MIGAVNHEADLSKEREVFEIDTTTKLEKNYTIQELAF